MPTRALASIFVFFLTAALAREAHAERVAVQRPSGASEVGLEIFARLCGELRQHDFEVLVIEPGHGSTPAEIVTLLPSESDNRAVVEIELHGSTSPADAALKLVGGLGEDGPRLLAAQVVDVLRAFPHPAPVRAEPTIAPASPAPSPQRSMWALRVEGLLLTDFLRFGVAGGPAAALEVYPSSRFYLAISGAGPLWGFHDQTSATQVRVTQALVTSEAGVRAWTGDRVALVAALGLGAYYFRASGDVIRHEPGLSGRSDSLLTLALVPALRASFRINGSLDLQAGVQAVWLATRPVVFSQEEPRAVGRSIAGASLGLRWEL